MHKATGTHPSTQRRRPIFGEGEGRLEATSYPVDDIHQGRTTYGVGAWEITFEEGYNMDRLVSGSALLSGDAI